MRNVKTYLAAPVRWLGVVADFAASAASGAPIGITTALTDTRGRKDSSGEGHEGSSAEGLDP
jgi:hypothetical protein